MTLLVKSICGHVVDQEVLDNAMTSKLDSIREDLKDYHDTVITPKPEVEKSEKLPPVQQGTIDVFLQTCCEVGTSHERHFWIKTEQFYEPLLAFYNVYKAFTDSSTRTAVKYTDFKQGLLTNPNIFVLKRWFPLRNISGRGKTSKWKECFVGVRLKARPPTEIELDVIRFVEASTEYLERQEDIPETTVSVFFRAFNTAYPGWTAQFINQTMLDRGFRLGKNRLKGEKAWINLLMKPGLIGSDTEEADSADDDEDQDDEEEAEIDSESLLIYPKDFAAGIPDLSSITMTIEEITI